MTLLSTGFLVDLMRRDPPAIELLRRLERASSAIRLPAVVFADLAQAAAESRHPPREWERVLALLDGYAHVALEPRHATRAGALAAKHSLPLREALLLAVAIEDREDVVVREGARYAGIEGLRVTTY